MATTFRTEDEAIAAEMEVRSFSGPHFHTEYEKDAEGNLTERTEIQQDEFGQWSAFVTVQVPCSGCWY